QSIIKAKANNTRCEVTLSLSDDEIPLSKLILQVENWDENLESVSIFNGDESINLFDQGDPPKIKCSYENKVLTIQFLQEALKNIQDGSIISLVAYSRYIK